MNSQKQKALIGSNTAKGGFKNEHEIVAKFNDFKIDLDAQKWLRIMGYDHLKIESLNAFQIPTRIKFDSAIDLGITEEKLFETQKYKKADAQIQVQIISQNIIYRENISLKKANSGANFNQIDKRPVSTYQEMWNFNDITATALKKFTGEIIPTIKEGMTLRDKRRWYLDELTINEKDSVLNFFKDNKLGVFNDIIRGRGALSAEWFLVTKKEKNGNIDWVLKDINFVVNFFAQGAICVSERGGLKLGRITAQRKGGTPDPKSLQFKICPLEIFDIK